MALKFDLEGIEDYMGGNLRLFITLTVGLLVFVALIALSVFFIAVRGKEEVMVPDVLGKELTEALVELQEKELYPRISLRASAGGEGKGLVLEQDPAAGNLVKAERRINLVVSQGMALDKMGNFLGKNINDVRLELQSFNTNSPETTITIKEPFMYQYSNDAAGTVLQQSPMPGTDLTGSATLELVVSRGQESTRITVPDMTGISFTDAIARLGQLRAGFSFTLINSGEGQTAGDIISQNPPGGTEINADGKVTLIAASPEAAEGETAGLFKFNLPLNPYPLPLTVEAELPNGSRRSLVSTNHAGGEFSMPYVLPSGSVIILSMVEREIFRQRAETLPEE